LRRGEGVGGRSGGHQVGVVQAGSPRPPDGCIETALRTRLSGCPFLLRINGGKAAQFNTGSATPGVEREGSEKAPPGQPMGLGAV